MIQGLNPGGGKIFLFSITFRPSLGPTQPPMEWVFVFLPGDKVAGA
jgi:hypothetical protein